MKAKNYTILFYLIINLCFSQNQAGIDSLKKLGRDSLIKLAVEKIKEPGFDSKNYDRIIVKANKNSLKVEFRLSIRISTNKSCYYDAVYVALVGSGTGASIQGDCNNPKYYILTKSDQKKIDFIFNAVNKENEIGDIPDKKMKDGSKMEITEKLTYYYIEMSSFSTYSHYKIDKITGKISEAAHKHYARNDNEKDEFEIIK